MGQFADVVEHKDELWRKALDVVVLVASMATTPIASLLDTTDGTLKAFPAGWIPLGRPTEDGITWPRETEVSELFGLGSRNPGRSDIRRSTKRVSMTIMEANRKVLELAQGIDLTGVTSTLIPATTGEPEVTWDEPEIPIYGFMRLIAVARDVTATGEMYIGRELLRCKVTEVGEETWSDQDSAMVTPLTFTAYHDSTEGSAMRHFRGGPGFAEVVTAEGWV